MGRNLIVSIGNRFMRDDGIGPSILDALSKRDTPADLIDIGTDIFKLSLYGEGYDQIVILDSFRGGGAPGKVLSFSGEGLTRSLDARIRSAHLIGSIEALELLRAVKPALRNVRFHMVGIIAAEISTGEGLSPEVERSIPAAVDLVESILLE